jgi:hypothetical protein
LSQSPSCCAQSHDSGAEHGSRLLLLAQQQRGGCHTLAHAAAGRDLYPLNSTPLSLRLPPTAFLKLVSNFFALSLLGLAPSSPAILSKKESKAVPLSLTTLLDVKPKKKSTSFAADVRE